MRNSISIDLEHLHHLVAQVVDDLDRDAALLRLVEPTSAVAAQGGPRLLIDRGFEGRLEPGVRVVRAEEVGVAYEAALPIVVGVEEPAGDTVGAIAHHFPSLRFEDVDSVHLYA